MGFINSPLQLLFPLTLLLELKIVIYKLGCQVGVDSNFDVQLFSCTRKVEDLS